MAKFDRTVLPTPGRVTLGFKQRSTPNRRRAENLGGPAQISIGFKARSQVGG